MSEKGKLANGFFNLLGNGHVKQTKRNNRKDLFVGRI